MEKLYALFRRIPFRAFQFRLFFYLLLFGTAISLTALFCYYLQAAPRWEENVKANLKQQHLQTVERIQFRLEQIQQLTDVFISDPIFDQTILGNDYPKDALDSKIQNLKKKYPFIQDVCVQYVSASSFCTTPEALNRLSKQGSESSGVFEPVSDENSLGFGLIYQKSFYGSDINWMKGRVAVFTDLALMLSSLDLPIDNEQLVIFDEKGRILYKAFSDPNKQTPTLIDQHKEITIEQKSGLLISQIPFQNADMIWISQLTEKLEGGSPLLHYGWISLLSAIAVTLLLTSAILLIFSRFYTKPLQHLRILMKKAEHGDLKAYWTVNGPQEIHELGQSYNQMLNRVEDLIKQVKLEEALKKEAEIEALQYQLNPHFLYNTLNTIKWVAKIHKTPQISEVVSSLVRLLQASIGKKGDFITLREEIGLIKDYMEIQVFRYGDTVNLEIEAEPVTQSCLVPRLLLQPLVENALIHGFGSEKEKGTIRIQAWIDRDMLYCQVEDNGRGMPEQILKEHDRKNPVKEKMSGVGLRHIREKIKLYYGQDYKMHIFSKEPRGTTIRLSLPIHRGEDL